MHAYVAVCVDQEESRGVITRHQGKLGAERVLGGQSTSRLGSCTCTETHTNQFLDFCQLHPEDFLERFADVVKVLWNVVHMIAVAVSITSCCGISSISLSRFLFGYESAAE